MTTLEALEAEVLAERLLEAIDHPAQTVRDGYDEKAEIAADRAQVESDVRVIRAVSRIFTGTARVDEALDVAHKAASDGLRRMAVLYGIDVEALADARSDYLSGQQVDG